MSDPKPTLAEAIWTSSRADESTISYIGANHVAAGVLDYLTDCVQREDVVEAVAQTLINEGAAPGNSIHSWRCEYPDQYGPCNCVKAVADASLAALVEKMRGESDG